MTTDAIRHDHARAESAATIAALAKLGVAGPFDLGIVLGTGLGPLADDIEDPVKVSYADIPGFPAGYVSGHARQLVAGRLAGKRVVTLNGRAILDVFEGLNQQGMTILMVTHDDSVAFRCKRVVRLADGLLEYDRPSPRLSGEALAAKA
jgi:hypothetical protein